MVHRRGENICRPHNYYWLLYLFPFCCCYKVPWPQQCFKEFILAHCPRGIITIMAGKHVSRHGTLSRSWQLTSWTSRLEWREHALGTARIFNLWKPTSSDALPAIRLCLLSLSKLHYQLGPNIQMSEAMGDISFKSQYLWNLQESLATQWQKYE